MERAQRKELPRPLRMFLKPMGPQHNLNLATNAIESFHYVVNSQHYTA